MTIAERAKGPKTAERDWCVLCQIEVGRGFRILTFHQRAIGCNGSLYFHELIDLETGNRKGIALKVS